MELRAIRVERLVQVGELSSARQALEGAALAPGNQATLRQLTDAPRRPHQPRELLSAEVLNHVPPLAFDLDECSTETSDRRRGERQEDFLA